MDASVLIGRDHFHPIIFTMRVVFLNQYYPPDAAPTGVMLEGVVERMIADGHEVIVLCAAGGYAGPQAGGDHAGWVGGGDIRRIGATRFGRGSFVGKLLDYISYYLGVAWRLLTLHPRPNRIVALTTPPYLSVLARAISKLRGADHAHWVMDLYPDVMAAHGMLAEGGIFYRCLSGFARWGFGGKRCVAVLALGPDMAERIDRLRGKESGLAEWVPLWSSTLAEDSSGGEQELRRQRGWAEDQLVVMYSGNMGLGHRFGEILAAAAALHGDPADGKPRLVFFGKGKRRLEVETFVAKHPGGRVELHDYAPAKILSAHLRSADVHLVSLDPAWSGTMVPSKLQGIFTVGRPVIFIGSAVSSIGRWVEESGAGWRVEPDDVAGLLTVLKQAADPVERARRSSAATVFAARHFDRNVNIARVAQTFVRRK